MAKKEKQMPLYVCHLCGEQFRGNGYTRHEEACRRKYAMGDSIKLYPVPLPRVLHTAFSNWCARERLTLAEGVEQLIKEKTGV